MNTQIRRFASILLMLFFLKGQAFADIAIDPANQSQREHAPLAGVPSWPAVAGTGLLLCIAVMLAVCIARRTRRNADSAAVDQK